MAMPKPRLLIPQRLQPKQLRILPILGDQLLVGADFQEGAVLEEEDTVGHADGGEAVRDEYGRAVFDQLAEAEEYLVLGAGVQGGGGLVQDQELGVLQQCRPDAQALPHTERVGPHLVVAALGQPELGTDPKYATNADRLAHRDEIVGKIMALTVGWTKADLLAACEREGIPAGPINDVGEAFAVITDITEQKKMQQQ